MNRMVGLGVGLVSLLVVVAIMLVVYAKYQIPVAKTGKATQDKAADISGREFIETVGLEGRNSGSRQWVEVTRVDPGGPAATYYGLMVNDRIVRFGTIDVETVGADMAATMIVDAYRHPTQKWPLVVIRNGQQVTLPAGAAPPPGRNTPNPSTPSGADPLAPLRGKIQTP